MEHHTIAVNAGMSAIAKHFALETFGRGPHRNPFGTWIEAIGSCNQQSQHDW